MSSLAMSTLARRARWSVAVLILSAYNRREYVVGMLGAGALGYVLKDDPPETLPAAVRAVRAGRQWLSPRVTELLVKSASDDERIVEELTEREKEVLRLGARGPTTVDVRVIAVSG